MSKNDTRVQFTKSVLKTALLELLHKKPISKISVKELCEKAGLNRSTFYLHYGEPNDVLRDIEEDTIEQYLPAFNCYSEQDSSLHLLTDLFRAMQQGRELFELLMGPHGSPLFADRIRLRMWEEVKRAWHREFPSYTEEQLEFVYNYVFAGSLQAQLTWMREGHELSTEALARRLDRLGHYCHLAIREF